MAENTTSVALVKDISDTVMVRINDMMGKHELVLPDNYNAGTALRSAMLIIQDTKDKNGRTALDVCTKASVVNSLLNMCIQGLQPSKRQCYFITYGNQLQLFRSYFGTQCALRRAVPGVHKIVADLVRYNDEVEWATSEYGERYVARIVSDPFENADKPYKYGFCNIYDHRGELLASCVMSWADIQTSWKQSRNWKAADGVHQKFPEEMAKRTLINRACKNLLNGSADIDAVVAGAFNQTTDAEYEKVETPARPAVQKAKTIKERYQIAQDQPIETAESTIPYSADNTATEESITEAPEDIPEEYETEDDDPFAGMEDVKF